MLEKLKDLLYDTSDLLLALVILLVMSSVITWQVSDSMAFSSTDEVNTGYMNATDNEELQVPEKDVDITGDDMVIIEDEDETTTEDEVEITKDSEATDELPAQSVEVVEEKPAEATTSITIEIPSGTPGVGIAQILKDNNLIQDTSTFVTRVEELDLAVKLKSGTYNINNNASLDDIIYIITGQKR